MTIRIALTTGCLAVLSAAASPCLANDPYAATAAIARKEATAVLGSAGVFSVTTAVLVDGTIVYAEAFGAIGSDRATLPDTRTQFNAGSISKVFTAVAMLRLRDQGNVDLDLPVVHYLPQFRMSDARYSQITVRMLLDHTAGIPGTNYYELFGAKPNPDYVTQTMALLESSALKSEPGGMNVYCNDCFTAAQALIERVSGKSFAEFVLHEIFANAGMADSSYGVKEGNRNIAAIYAPGARATLLPPEYVSALASGGMTTTAVDLCLFARALLDGQLLGPSSLELLQRPQPGRYGAGYSLAHAGLGWDSVAEPAFAPRGITVLGKDGITAFFRSQMYVAPKENVAVATILAGPAATSVAVVSGISKNIMWAALKDSGKLPESRRVLGPVPPPVATIPEDVLAYEGIYGGFGHSIMRLTFDRTANTLRTAKLADGQFVPGGSFSYHSDGRFYAPNHQGYSFARSEDGRRLLRHHIARDAGEETLLEGVSGDEQADTSEFDGMTWVPQNLRASDFVTLSYAGLYKTDSLAALPGIVYLHAGNPGDATPYALADKHSTRMLLQYETDLEGLQITISEGRKILRVGAFEFADAASVPALAQSESVVVEPSGRNVARRVIAGGSFASTLPAGGRILIYAPQGPMVFDSLFDSHAPVLVSPGSVVLFIGEPGALFAAQVT